MFASLRTELDKQSKAAKRLEVELKSARAEGKEARAAEKLAQAQRDKLAVLCRTLHGRLQDAERGAVPQGEAVAAGTLPTLGITGDAEEKGGERVADGEELGAGGGAMGGAAAQGDDGERAMPPAS